jgi:hypothetical protein
MLADLLGDIELEFPPEWERWIHVVEDRVPDVVYPDKLRDRFERWSVHQWGGVEAYQDLIRTHLDIAFTQSWNRVLQIPDDVRLAPDFFRKIEATWQAIDDADKVCVSPLLDGRESNWTGWRRLDIGPAYLTQWNDLCYWSDRRWMDFARPLPRIRRKSQGSGIGSYLSHKAHSEGLRMYHVKETLVYHGDHPSVMHGEHRKAFPIIA